MRLFPPLCLVVGVTAFGAAVLAWMRWLKRSLWLAAWSFWLWLGFGLHRELPRDLGPVVSELAFQEREWPQGFSGVSTELITFECDPQWRRRAIRRWNAATGELLATINDGPLTERRVLRDGFSPQFDYYLCGLSGGTLSVHPDELRRATMGQPNYALNIHTILNIKSGAWRDLPKHRLGSASFHSTKPWAAVYESPRLGGSGVVQVLDLESSRLVFEWRVSPREIEDREFLGAPFFLGDDRLVIPTRPRGREGDSVAKSDRLEVWRLSTTKRERVVTAPSVYIAWEPESTESERILCHLPDSRGVFDFSDGRLVFCIPREKERRELWHRFEDGDELDYDVLSPSGRSLLTANSHRLFEVDSGRLLWEPHRHDHVLWSRGDRFEVYENWRVVTPWRLTRLETFGSRDLKTGTLLYRTWRPTLRHGISSSQNSPIMIVGNKSYAFPPAANYPLLALCQTILVLPLVMLWAGLRWRRNRRLRVASVQA